MTTKERLSFLAIRVSLGIGGSFLAAAFILQAYLQRGFLIPAAPVIFVLIALTARSFAGMRIPIFSLSTVIWFILLYLIQPLIAQPR